MSDVIHLVRRDHDGGALSWCGEDLPIGWQGWAAEESGDATCLRCLENGQEFGRGCRNRWQVLVKLPGALDQP